MTNRVVVRDGHTNRLVLLQMQGTGQFIKACIVITPSETSTNLVEVEVLPDLKHILRSEIEPKVLSDLGASLYARQLAIHLNVSIF